MSYSPTTFAPNHFWREGYQQQQSQPQVLATSFHGFGHRAAPHHHCAVSTEVCYSQPRYLPQYDLARSSTYHEHDRDESYIASSDSHGAKGRSLSGTTTDITDYEEAVVSNSPQTTYFLDEAGGQYAITGRVPDEAEEESPHGSRDRYLLDYGQLENGTYHVALAQHDGGVGVSSNSLTARMKLPCPHSDCIGRDGRPKKFFSRKADVTRHVRSQHQKTFIDCPRLRCNRKGTRGFTRKDHLTEHLRGFHMEDHAKRQAKKNTRKRKIKLHFEGKTPPKPSPSCSTLPETVPKAGIQDSGDEDWLSHGHEPELDTPTPKEEEETFAELNTVYHGHEADTHRNISTSPGQRHVPMDEHGQQWGDQQHETYHGFQWQRSQATGSPEISTTQAHTMVNAVPQMYTPYENLDHFIHNAPARQLYHSSHTFPTSR
ncbi:hypothetical protein EDD37DRAFT_612296 [Exophiala viscosa]|uniref:C2H2-type domain-containing protein n=1 Tax=Exophiala viscosa TaxID=2486360 RepID=A0AAN6I9N4_9EURO|nr:hypothetical protein EDD36DRAFT_81704 [Exophiala viscosa]KAI1620836.1 hypothetical protein EDD37DRAFT_612296 [Exophiala viscosa]